MGTKLKNLKISRVDFVDAGANPESDILLRKRKEDIPPKSSISKGRGGETEVDKKEGFIQAIKGLLGIAKEDPKTFDDVLQDIQLRDVTNQAWDVCYAFSDSICSILRESENDRTALLEKTLAEFEEAVSRMIPSWAAGEPVANVVIQPNESEPANLELAKIKLAALISQGNIEKDSEENDSEPTKKAKTIGHEAEIELSGEKNGSNSPKGDNDMKVQIDKSRLPAEQQEQLDALLKAAGATELEEATPPAALSAEEPPVAKGHGAVADMDNEDIYKGLHPKVAAELQELRKHKEHNEEKELLAIAKRYEVIGKKPEELVATFKSLKAAGGSLFDETLGALDGAVAALEKSGLFRELGNNGHGGEHAPELLIEKKAHEIQKARPELNVHQARELAWEQNPDLAAAYENQ